MKYIEHLGVHEAIKNLMPTVHHAGIVACMVQRGIHRGIGPTLTKDLGNAFADALTDADILVEDMIGGAALALFQDVSFYGEEHEKDHISRYAPVGCSWLVTLDPINGTRYFKNGLHCFETVVTFCAQDSIRGAIVHFPWSGRTMLAANTEAFHMPSLQPGDEPYKIPRKAPRTILLGSTFADKRQRLEAQGYTVVVPSLDYHDTGPWDICPAGILDGRICGMALGPGQQLIDNVAIAHVAWCAGAYVEIEGLDFKTKLADRIVAATNAQIFSDITQAIEG